MPLVTFSNGAVADATEVNANFALCVLTDTIRTIAVSHIWSAAQRFGDGSAAAPAIQFTNDADSGLYRIGANNVGVAVGGSKVLDIAASGLTVTGALTASGNINTSAGAVQVGGTTVITSGRAVQNVTIAASLITSGNLAFGRLPSGGGTWAVGGDLVLSGGSLAWGGGAAVASSSEATGYRHSSVTAVGTGGATAKTVLMSHALPTLASGSLVEIFAIFNVTGTADIKNIYLRIGATDLFAGDSIPSGTTGTAVARAWLIRDGGSTYVYTRLDRDDSAESARVNTVAEDLSGATIALVGEASNAGNEITAEAWTITLAKAP